MAGDITVNERLNCEGLACPMPVVKTKKAVDVLQPGHVIEVRATDKGSVADLQGWAKRTGHHYLGLKEENGIYRHFIRKATPEELKDEVRFPHTVANEDLIDKLNDGNIQVIDVREPAEYAFGHIPGATNIPLDQIEGKLTSLDPEKEYHIVCRSGNRSDMACSILAEKGFKQVKNVIPGMSAWSGPLNIQ